MPIAPSAHVRMRRLLALLALGVMLGASHAQPSASHLLNLRDFDTICIYGLIGLDGEIDWALGRELGEEFRERARLLEVTPDDCADTIRLNGTELRVTVAMDGLTTDAGIVYSYWVEAKADLFFTRVVGERTTQHEVEEVAVYHYGGYGITPTSAWDEAVRDTLREQIDEFVFEFKRQTNFGP